MLAGAGVTFLEGLVINEPSRFHPETFSTASILAVAYLVVFGSMVAFTTIRLLRNAPLSLVSTYAYVNPVVAVALDDLPRRADQPPDDHRLGGHPRRGGDHRDRPQAVSGRASRPRRRLSDPHPARPRAQAGCPSASTVRLTRRAIAITVTIGFTPMPVGNVALSAT